MGMDHNFEEERKEDGFIGERMIILPTEVFSGYIENPLVKRFYLTDVGFFPRAANHYMDRKEGIEEYIFLYCTEGEGIIHVKGKEYVLKEREAFCIPRFQKHCYYSKKITHGVFCGFILKEKTHSIIRWKSVRLSGLNPPMQQIVCYFCLNSSSGFLTATIHWAILFIFLRCWP